MYDQLYDEQLSLLKKEAAHLVQDITPLQKFADFAREHQANYELNDYADPYRKRFPIRDKYNSYMSKIYLHKTASDIENGDFKEIDAKINASLTRFGIDPHAILSELDAPIVKSANVKEPENFALQVRGKNLFPIDSQEDMQKAANYFNTKYNQFNILEKREFSKNLIEKIAKDNVDISLKDTNVLEHAIAFGDIQSNIKLVKTAFDMQPIVDKSNAIMTLTNYRENVKSGHSKEALDKAIDIISEQKDHITSSRTISKIANLLEKIGSHENYTLNIEELISYFEGTE